ncbi:methyltransferase [Shewanella phage vB_SbaS_Y11]|nr:methyltransferase [Shewanella phage vB_SbaS_Y11]
MNDIDIKKQQREQFLKGANTKDKGFGGHALDAGLSLLSGAVSVPEAVVGLADIPTGGRVGKFLENEGGALGFRPKEAKEAIAGAKTERSRQQLQDFQEAEGFGAKFGQALENKSLITNTILESLPAMGAGGVVGRGLGAVAPRIGGVAAGALGEGAVGAGLAAEQIRQQTDDGLLTAKQSGLSAATGATTAGFGYAGGRLARQLGIGDVDTMFATGSRAAGTRAATEGAEGAAKQKGVVRRALEGALTEGLLEELPQSVSETVLQNIALNRPIEEGVDEAAVLGILSGGVMGAGAGAATRNRQSLTNNTDDASTAELVDTEDMGQEVANYGAPKSNVAGLLGGPSSSAPQLGFGGTPADQYNVGPDGDVFTADQYNDYLAGQRYQDAAARDAGMKGFNDVSQTPEGYEQFGSDPQLPPPRSDYEVRPDGTVLSPEDFNADLQAQREQNAARLAARMRGEITDNTQVPQEAVGYGDLNTNPNYPQLPAPRNDFEVTPDGTALTPQDTSAYLQQQRDAKEARERGYVADRTPVPKEATGYGDLTPSQQMGLDPNKGSLSAAAALAVDSGASQRVMAEQQAQAAVEQGMMTQASTQAEPTQNTRMAGLVEVENQEQPTGSKWLQGMRSSLANADPNDANYQAVAAAIEADPKSVPERARLKKQVESLAKKPEPTVKTVNPKARVLDETKAKSVAYNPRGDEIPTQFDVVDASELVSSHSNNFVENPNYPQQYQPRDRAKAGYQAQVLEIFNKFKPHLLGDDNSVNAGSPIVGPSDNLVESGNGRTIAIRKIYEAGKGDAYRQFVNEQAEKFGLDTNAINNMQQPVLVRRNMSGMDRETFARRANDPASAEMSATERAQSDARILPSTDLLEFTGDGELNLNASYGFTQKFIQELGVNEANNLVTKSGQLSQSGENRVMGAILHNAYGSKKITDAVTSELGVVGRNVLKSITSKAPQVTKLNNMTKEGKLAANTLAEDIKTAAETYIDLVESKQKIDDFLKSDALFASEEEFAMKPEVKEIIGDFHRNARSAVAIGRNLQARIDAIVRAGDPEYSDLLAGIEEEPQANTQEPAVNQEAEVNKNKAPASPSPAPTKKGSGTKISQKLESVIEQQKAIADDWRNREYKSNKGKVQVRTSDADIDNTKSIDSINESRRNANINQAEHTIAIARKLDAEIESKGLDSYLDGLVDMYEKPIAFNDSPTQAEKDAMFEARYLASINFDGDQSGATQSNDISKVILSSLKDHIKNKSDTKQASEPAVDENKSIDETLNEFFGEDKAALKDKVSKPVKKPVAKKADKPVTKKADKPAATEAASEIDDFGEKIVGARKDMDAFHQKEMTDDDIASQPLSKIWAKKEIDDIDNKQLAAIATVLRATIPSKPRKGYKLNQWVEKVKNARKLMQQVLSDELPADEFLEMMTKVEALRSMGYHAQLLDAIDREQWSRVTSVSHRPFHVRVGEDGERTPDMGFDVTIDKRRYLVDTQNRLISEAVDKVNEILSNKSQSATELKFDVYGRGRGDKRSYFIAQASDKDKTPLIEFNDLTAAREFKANNNAELTELWDQHKEKVNVKKADMRSKQNRDRIGPDHRQGQDVTTEQFMETFGLRGGQFGNWVKQGANSKDRQGMLNDTYDAFMDLSGVLGVPPEAIGLGGKLAMSFGARGKGAAMAHYEPSQVVINLTKTKGAGSLAHEWFHALDHHFTSFRDSPARNKSREDTYITYKPEPSMMYAPKKGRGYLMSKPALERRRESSKDPMYAAENWVPDPNHPEGVRPKVEEAFAELVNTLNHSPMTQRAATIDKGATDGYWSRIIERAARAFESYVIHKLDQQGARSDFLANVTPENAFPRNMDRYPYLLESEMAPVAEAFDNLFTVIDSKASEDGNGKTLFSRMGQIQQAADKVKANAVGSTNTTRQQVLAKLNDKFGKETIDKLMAAGKLDIKTLNDYVVDGNLTIPSDVDGLFHNGKATLIADNLSDDMIIPTFLHELGGHGGMQTLMDKKAYDALMKDFDAMVSAGDPLAVEAKAMADSVARNEQDALDEYLPYLITLASRKQAKQGKLAGMINRMVMAIRSWLKNTLGVPIKVNAQDILSLAERMVEARTQPPLNNIQSPINSFEGVNAPADQIKAVREKQSQELRKAPNGKPSNLTEQQWLQVRTPAFKQWFGDWENDPANASKILDENGEPLVLYHGSKSDFWVFDMSRSVPQRNEGMMGMFFTDNAKTAAGYTVDLRKEAAVVKAKDNLSKINNEFSFKRRQLETENKTGDEIQELTKKEFEAMKAAELKLKAIIADAFNNAYDNAESRTKAVFVKSQMPFEQDADGKSFLAANKKAAERYFVDGVYDGIVNNNVLDDANANHSVGAAKVVVSFDATNIKSATDNVGAFSKTNDDIRYSQSNDGMKFSRAAGMSDPLDPVSIAKQAGQRFQDWATSKPAGKVSWWHNTVGTMYNLAERNPLFKPVYEHTEKFINDVSFYAAKASEMAPRLLPKLDSWRDLSKTAVSAKDNEAISKPIFEGTLIWGRDLNGKAVLIDDWRKKVMATSKQDRLNMLRNAGRITPAQEAELAKLNAVQANRFINGIIDDEVSAGLVWTDSELRSKFNLSDEHIELYREFRATTDNSLDSMTRSDMLRKLGKNGTAIEKEVMEAGTLREAVYIIEQHANSIAAADPSKSTAMSKVVTDVKASAYRSTKLMDDGYAPLSRFGKFTVDVVDAAGEREYFGLFESAYEARKMAEEMRALYGDDAVTQGALSEQEFKLFAGVTPETAELFGEMLGLDATGDKDSDDAFQEYLRRTKNNRSTMKRLMHRKGIKGYSEDVGRVLASFVYSNARHTSAALNMGNLDRSISDIPKSEGQLKDVAIRLAQYIKNPQEEGHVIRGFMFAQYLGGSIASAAVNLTQPIAVSFPYLSQFGGAVKAAAEIGRASKDWASGGNFDAELTREIARAEADGTLSPQEVHNLLRMARGQNPLAAGDGTKYGDAKAMAQNAASRVGVAWGAFFSLAEQANRRVTFVAAYRMAKDQGMDDPAGFARKSIKETQFVYNKASRMRWGRGAVGGTVMTFKTYSVSYIELMHRLWNQGEKGSVERKEGRKAAMLMVATIFLLSGTGGLPFMEDAEDVIDGFGQMMGYNMNTRKARDEFLDEIFGEMAGDFLESGISSIHGMPTDISSRLGMDNLIPATGIFKERTNNTRDVMELAGPAGDFIGRTLSGARTAVQGAAAGDVRQVARGALEATPVAVRNAVKGADMLESGMYKDTKGYKVIDTSPLDAAVKALGFQPKNVSKAQNANYLAQSELAFYTLKAAQIRALWAQGVSEKNKGKVDDARAALENWNSRNPDQPITIRPTDIARRVREMNMTKDQRTAKRAPTALRSKIAYQLQDAND